MTADPTPEEAVKTMIRHEIEELKTRCRTLREEGGSLAQAVKALKGHALFTRKTSVTVPELDAGEAIANVMLAYRHLEDARMRLGKVIQACEGGESIYDQAPAPAN